MKGRCCPLIILIISLLVCSTADENHSHKLVKRQVPSRTGGDRAIPLSRSRQYPPPEELEESEYELSEDEDEKLPASPFRGRQLPSSDDYSEETSYTEAPKTTTPTPQRSSPRTSVFNNRSNSRPRFGAQFTTKSTSTTSTSKPSTTSNSNPRFRATPAQSQRFDVVANILNKPAPPRSSSSRNIAPARSANENLNQKPTPETPSTSDQASRRNGGTRIRMRGRPRSRSSTTTTTTTTTTQKIPEEYYYYYEDEDEQPANPPIATTTSTTTTTTTPRPSLPKRPTLNRRPSSSRTSKSSPKPVVKFDPESQFQPPPDDVVEVVQSTSSTKRFTTSTTTEPPGGFGDIPVHLRHKYKPRTDGRFIDFLRDPNRPRELKGFDLTDYPFYVKVPEDIVFDCDDKKDGYYASIPHKCQLFHYCFAGARYDFLCANYTLYDQTTFTCRFANNVDCLSSEKYYYRNDDLWKETTTPKPQTTTPKKRKPRPRDYDDDDDEYDYEEYDDEEKDEEDDPQGGGETEGRTSARKPLKKKNRKISSSNKLDIL